MIINHFQASVEIQPEARFLNNRQIPESLKKYQDDILAGIAAAERRRIELSTAWSYPTRSPAGPASFASLQDRPAAAGTEACQSSKVSLRLTSRRDNGAGNLQSLQHVKFWPLMGVAAHQHGEGGAWKLWALAKSLDKKGTGAIPLAELQALVRELGVPQKTWRRWLAAARRLTLVRDRTCGDGWVVLASHAWAAVLLGCEDIGTRPASIRAGDLVGKGCWAYVWAAYEATHGGRQISRATQEKLTGVPTRTQRAYDNQSGVDRRSHYAISERETDELTGMAEFEDHPGAFKFYDKKRRRLTIAWRLPDSRTTSSAESLQRGRSKKISKDVKRLNFQRENGSSILGRVECFDPGNVEVLRIFHMTGPQLRATERKIARMDLQPARELYLHRSYGRRADLWTVVPQGGQAV